MKCEYYENGILDYYYTSEFNRSKEMRSYYKNEKKYATAVYVDGRLAEYKEL